AGRSAAQYNHARRCSLAWRMRISQGFTRSAYGYGGERGGPFCQRVLTAALQQFAEAGMHSAIDIGVGGQCASAGNQQVRLPQIALRTAGYGRMGLADSRRTGCQWITRLTPVELGVHDVAATAMGYLRLAPGYLEAVIAALQVGPEAEVRIVAMLRHVLRRHAERKCLNLKRLLAAFQRL